MTENQSLKSPKKRWKIGNLHRRERLNSNEILNLPRKKIIFKFNIKI